MSATERVRELLDERGVEYTANERDTQWWPKNNPAGVLAENSRYPHGTLDVYGLTPEQAIDATLGSSSCSNSCTDGERTDVPRLPHFWTHDGTLHIEATRMPTRIVVCEGGTCEFVPKRELDASEAENAKLWELGEQYETVLADYRSEVAKLRELCTDMWFWGYEGHMDSKNQEWQMKHIDGVLERMRELGVEVDE